MSWLSDLFGKLFGRRKREESPPTPPRPVDPAYQAYLDQKNAAATTPVPTTPVMAPDPPQPAVLPQPLPGPALQTSGEPNDPGFLPEPARTDIYGRPVAEAPFGRKQDGSPFASMDKRRSYYQALAIRDGNLHQIEEDMKTAQANGLFDPRSLSDIDCEYLAKCSTEMTFDPRYLAIGLFFGPDVGRLGSQKYWGAGPVHFHFAEYEPQVRADVRQAVREMAQREVKPWMAKAFSQLAGHRKDEYLTGWYNGWKRLHPGQEP